MKPICGCPSRVHQTATGAGRARQVAGLAQRVQAARRITASGIQQQHIWRSPVPQTLDSRRPRSRGCRSWRSAAPAAWRPPPTVPSCEALSTTTTSAPVRQSGVQAGADFRFRIVGDDDDSDVRHVSLCPTAGQQKVQLPVRDRSPWPVCSSRISALIARSDERLGLRPVTACAASRGRETPQPLPASPRSQAKPAPCRSASTPQSNCADQNRPQPAPAAGAADSGGPPARPGCGRSAAPCPDASGPAWRCPDARRRRPGTYTPGEPAQRAAQAEIHILQVRFETARPAARPGRTARRGTARRSRARDQIGARSAKTPAVGTPAAARARPCRRGRGRRRCRRCGRGRRPPGSCRWRTSAPASAAASSCAR